MDAAAWTAIGTVGLALATIVLVLMTARYVRLTRESVNAAKESAEAARETADATRRAAETAEASTALSERTVVLSTMPQILARQSGTDTTEGFQIRVQVENPGPTTAYNVKIELFSAQRPSGPGSPLVHLPQALVPGSDREVRVPFPLAYETWRSAQAYEIHVRYEDAVGNSYMARHWQHREDAPVSAFFRVGSDGRLDQLM